MLRRLHFKNFKSWRDTRSIETAPITGLFGANSSGKTSLIQLLLMLKQTADSPDRTQVLHLGDDRSGLINLGTFRDVVHGHVSPGSIEWSLLWDRPNDVTVFDPEHEDDMLFSGREIGFSASLAEDAKGRPVVQKMAYKLGGASFVMEPKPHGGEAYQLRVEGTSFKFKRAPGRAWELPHPAKCYGFPYQVRGYFQNAAFLTDLELALESFLSSVYYLGPLRDHPRREYTWGGDRPADMGKRGENVVYALLASREKRAVISRGRGVKSLTVEEYVAHWLRELGLIQEFSVEMVAKGSNLYRVWVQKHRKATKVLITDVGFGISQILPVITLCYYVPRGSVVILEQPEIHLHPSVQAGLADVLIDAVEHNGIQVIVESHSEHLLRRLQRRVAEGSLSADQAALYFARMDEDASSLERLAVDDFGRIANWPKDFFGDEFGEMAAMSRAIAERRRRGVA